jgi:hypothetical protein
MANQAEQMIESGTSSFVYQSEKAPGFAIQ